MNNLRHHKFVSVAALRLFASSGIEHSHQRNTQDEEFGTMDGIRVARPLRPIVDVISEETLSPDLIEQAINQAMQRGLFTAKQLGRRNVAASLAASTPIRAGK